MTSQELRERIVKGKFKIPYFLSTECEGFDNDYYYIINNNNNESYHPCY